MIRTSIRDIRVLPVSIIPVFFLLSGTISITGPMPLSSASRESAITAPTPKQARPNISNIVRPNLDPKKRTNVIRQFAELPLSFEANRGQADPRAKFVARGKEFSVFLTATEVVLALRGIRAADAEPEKGRHLPEMPGRTASRAVVRMEMLGANPAPRVTAMDPLPSKSNYFIGKDPARWRTNIPQYGRVRFREVYPGVDVVYYGNQGRLEFDLEIAPRADAGVIRLGFTGTSNLRTDSGENLVLETAAGEVRQEKPKIYQIVRDARRQIEGKYVIEGRNQVRIALGAYDNSRPLVIDPVISYATYLGGNSRDYARAIAVDAAGNAYITGDTYSDNFPLTPGAPYADFQFHEALVCKLADSGTSLAYSTYIGSGLADAIGYGISVDAAGNAYVTGYANGYDFPITPGAPQTQGMNHDAFVAKLDSSGSTLLYSVRLGGAGSDYANGIAIDNAGNAVITGYTLSRPFPTFNAYQPDRGGFPTGATVDAFAAKLNDLGTQWLYSTYLGGSSLDYGNAVAVDSSGNSYFTGYTYSSDFPSTPGAFRSTGDIDVFVCKFNASGSTLIYSALLGGSGGDYGNGIGVDAAGSAYITGKSYSDDFPITPDAVQPSMTGYESAFVTKLNPAGTALVFSTYLGGNGMASGNAIALDKAGNAWVTGETDSSNFPTVQPIQSELGTRYGVFKSINGGGHWDWSDNGLLPTGILALTVDPYDSDVAYAAVFPSRLFKTVNGGNIWSEVETGIAGGFNIHCLAIDPVHPATIYAGGYTGIIKSTDGASTWSKIYEDRVTALTLDPSNPSTLYAGVFGGIIKSTDSGIQWSSIQVGSLLEMFPYGSDVIVLAVDPHASGTLYVAGAGTKVWKTTDGGAIWGWIESLPSPACAGVLSLIIDPADSAVMYVAGLRGVSKSTDAGTSWTQLISGTHYLAMDPSNPAILYGWAGGVVGVGCGGNVDTNPDWFLSDKIYKTTNGGSTWVLSNSGLSDRVRISQLAVAPSDGETLYTGFASAKDAFVTKVNGLGTKILYSSYLGGPSNDVGRGICLDPADNVYVTGTVQLWDEFPATPGALQTSAGGYIDGFVIKLAGTQLAPVPEDFNDDGKADIVWRNTATGDINVWFMDGAAVKSDAWLPCVRDQQWQIAGIGDFDGDSNADLLWRYAPSGDMNLWFIGEMTVTGDGWLPRVTDPDWQIAGIGDFNKDGKSDLVWRNSATGDINVWFLSGSTVMADAWLPRVINPQWQIAGIGDFNNDGGGDIVWKYLPSGDLNVWLMDGTSVTSDAWLPRVSDPNWQIKTIGDFNGDGNAEIIWGHAVTRDLNIWFMYGTLFTHDDWLPRVADPHWKVVKPGN